MQDCHNFVNDVAIIVGNNLSLGKSFDYKIWLNCPFKWCVISYTLDNAIGYAMVIDEKKLVTKCLLSIRGHW